jgi:hypothetical protein
MKTTDLFTSNRSAKRLNESLQKTFGTRIDFEKFDTPQLEDARNKLRTQIHTARSDSGFNENLENDALSKAQFMHDAIVAELMDREEHIVDLESVEEGAMSEIAAELSQVADDEDYDKLYDLLSDPGPVGKYLQDQIEDITAETGLHPKDDFEKIEAMLMDMVQQEFGGQNDDEGGETDDNYAMTSAGFGSDEDYESIQYEDQVNEKAVSKSQQQAAGIALAARRKGETPSGKGAAAEMSKMSMKELEKFAGTKHKNLPAKKDESVETGEDMTKLQEGEVQQASAIVTAKTMVDRVSRWIEELSGMENDTLLQLGDSIRDEMGQEQAKGFISAVAPAIQQALENLKTTRETLATGVRTLTGEEQGAEMLGGEPGAEGGMDDLAAPAAPDAMNEPDLGADDEFAAAEPAAGGLGDAGREQRESINRSSSLLKVLAG